MSQEKYIGMDVHQATISAAVMDAQGKLIMECLLETKAATIVEFIRGLQGPLSLTFEEGTSAAWLHDLLKPHVDRLVVCDPRKAALLKDGNVFRTEPECAACRPIRVALYFQPCTRILPVACKLTKGRLPADASLYRSSRAER